MQFLPTNSACVRYHTDKFLIFPKNVLILTIICIVSCVTRSIFHITTNYTHAFCHIHNILKSLQTKLMHFVTSIISHVTTNRTHVFYHTHNRSCHYKKNSCLSQCSISHASTNRTHAFCHMHNFSCLYKPN